MHLCASPSNMMLFSIQEETKFVKKRFKKHILLDGLQRPRHEVICGNMLFCPYMFQLFDGTTYQSSCLLTS